MASFLKKGAPTSRIPLFCAVFDIYETALEKFLKLKEIIEANNGF